LCGKIQVPEDHYNNSENKIDISLVIINQEDQEFIDPLIILTGGPGGSAITERRVQSWLNNPISKNRKIIIFDQRGIGFSSPLKNMSKDFFSIFRKDLSFQKENFEIQKIINSYVNDAKRKGIDLSKYNTFQSANDVNAIMNALGFEKYNLYGGSYGTRLGRITQELHPSKLNSVILNSPNPLVGDMLVSRLISYSKSLSRVFEYCNNNYECNKLYPDLSDNYDIVLKELEKKSIKININNEPYYLNAHEGLYFIRRLLYSNDALTKIPLLIKEYENGGGPIIEGLIINSFRDSYNYAMWLAVEKYEMFNIKHDEKYINKIYNKLRFFPAKLGFFTSAYLSMNNFHENTLTKKEKKLKKSLVPTLITVNKYDPVTPPENGRIMAKDIKYHYLYIVNEAGHGGGQLECRYKIMIDFMNNPINNLDASCLNIIKKI
tara:strand:+ start:936 stop:2237 length:1302 start_codon:yes stop_codon:yes gene_type:complete